MFKKYILRLNIAIKAIANWVWGKNGLLIILPLCSVDMPSKCCTGVAEECLLSFSPYFPYRETVYILCI